MFTGMVNCQWSRDAGALAVQGLAGLCPRRGRGGRGGGGRRGQGGAPRGPRGANNCAFPCYLSYEGAVSCVVCSKQLLPSVYLFAYIKYENYLRLICFFFFFFFL